MANLIAPSLLPRNICSSINKLIKGKTYLLSRALDRVPPSRPSPPSFLPSPAVTGGGSCGADGGGRAFSLSDDRFSRWMRLVPFCYAAWGLVGQCLWRASTKVASLVGSALVQRPLPSDPREGWWPPSCPPGVRPRAGRLCASL